MIVKIDVDGVIRDIIGAMCKLYNKEFCEHYVPSNITNYNVDNYFPKVIEKYGVKPSYYYFIRRGEIIFKDMVKTFNRAKKSIELLKQHGHKVIIVTWQLNDDNKKFTKEFLDNNGILYDEIVFTKEKYSVNGDILIDDNPEFLTNNKETAIKICISRPYNKELIGIARANSLYDAVKLIV